MENNIGKHVFETSQYGCNYVGVVEHETEKTYSVIPFPGSRSHRVIKSGRLVLLPASADPDKAREAYSAAWRSFRKEVAEAEENLAKVKDSRKKAALDALLNGAI